MWNSVQLVGAKYSEIINLDVAVKKIADALIHKDFNSFSKIILTRGQENRILKAKKVLFNNENLYREAVFQLIKSNGLSKKVFNRTLSVSKYKNNDRCAYYYINYKHFVYIIEKIKEYINIIDVSIWDDLYKHSYYKLKINEQDCVTYRTIPIRKAIIFRTSQQYINGEPCALKNKHIQKKIYELNGCLDKLNR